MVAVAGGGGGGWVLGCVGCVYVGGAHYCVVPTEPFFSSSFFLLACECLFREEDIQ